MTTPEAAPRVLRAALYDRVSRDRHGTGRSTDEQHEENVAACAERGWTFGDADHYTDGDRSASRYATKVREEWPRLVAAIQDGRYDVIVLWEPSRGSRDLVVWSTLLEVARRHGVLIHITSHRRTYDLSIAREWRTLAEDGVDAAYESEKTRDRILRAQAGQAAKGRPHGALLWGHARVYDSTSGVLLRTEWDPTIVEVVREMADRVLSGDTCYRIAKDLTAQGIPTPRGVQRWPVIAVKRILTNPGYAGLRVARGQVVGHADWPAIIDLAAHHELVRRLNDPARKTRHDGAIRHLLSGIATCGAEGCGAGVRAQRHHKRTYAIYLCPEGFHVGRKVDWVDALVREVVVERLARPDAVELFSPRDSDEQAEAARAEAADLRAQLDGFYDSAATPGGITPQALARIEARLLPLIRDAERRAAPPVPPRLLADLIGREDVGARFDAMEVVEKREVIRTLITVRLLPSRKRQRGVFVPEDVEITWRTEAA